MTFLSKVVVQQLGARMDYAVPTALFEAGLLSNLVTDLYSRYSFRMFQKTTRYRPDISPDLISYSNKEGLLYKFKTRLDPGRSWPHVWASEALAQRTLAAVDKYKPSLVYGFDTAMLPSIEGLRRRGVGGIVLEQCIAPRSHLLMAIKIIEQRCLAMGISSAEAGMEDVLAYNQLLSAIETAEWAKVDRIYCPSEFVLKELVRSGVAGEKIRVLPYGVTMKGSATGRGVADSRERGYRLKVAFVGSVGLRKGALDFFELARRFKAIADFHCFGTIKLPGAVISKLGTDVKFHGAVPHERMWNQLSDFDLLVLPSYSEGSATVVYEAMAAGLCCVVSDATGSVISNGVDGYIFRSGDMESLAEIVLKLLDDPVRRRDVQQNARLTSLRYTKESYGSRVVAAIENDFGIGVD